MNTEKRLVVVSNRLPIVLQSGESAWTALPATGGLVTALTPVLASRGGVWIGWPGTALLPGVVGAIADAARQFKFELKPVSLSEDCIQGFYYGFANEILWPLFHGFETRCNFEPAYWQDYQAANLQFAEATEETLSSDDFLWVHDYHLMLVARELKRRRQKLQCAFFLHIPFPAPEVFFKLPWRKDILEGLLAYDLVGFQTLHDRRNFTQCLQQLRIPNLKISGRGAVVDIRIDQRYRRAGAFPISLDYQEIQRQAASEEVRSQAWLFHEKFPDRQIMIGVDRLDYTKGIPERLRAFGLALERYPELHGNLSMVQITVPSREQVPEYERLLAEIERLVGEINGRYTELGDWVPIHYVHRSFDRQLILAYLQAAEIAIVTPLRDGMNLVAKEYVACDQDEKGVLILSEFAGVVAEFKRLCLLVNPYDMEGVAAAIHRAYHMDQGERKRRMAKLRGIVQQHDIFNWVNSFIAATTAIAAPDEDQVEEYIPDFSVKTE